MSLTAPGTFQDLCAFIFRDHALKLNQELIFRAVALWRLHEPGLDSMAGGLLDQQNLVRVLATQSVWRIREHNLNLSFGGEITHTLQAWPLQRRSAVAFIFEHPLSGHFQIVALGKLDQRRRLARNRVLLALLLGRNPRVDCRHSHIRTPSRARQRSAHDMDQNLVSLRELRLEQAIKRIGNINLKMAALSIRLSHAALESAETHLPRPLRSLQP